MIAIVVGVNLVPTIVSAINTASQDAVVQSQMPGLAGLLQTLALTKLAPLQGNLHRITSRIRGNPDRAIPSQACDYGRKACVETMGEVPFGVVI